MDRVHVLSLVLNRAEARRQSARNDWTANTEVTLPFLIGRLIVRKRISRIQHGVFKQELAVTMKRARASTVYYLRSLLSVAVLAKSVRTVFSGKSVVVDANVLGLRLPALRSRHAALCYRQAL